VDGEFVSGSDTVAAVKEKVRRLIAERARPGQEAGAQPDLGIDEADRISFGFAGRQMQDDRLFYADHFMLLPAWVQVFLHRCGCDEFRELVLGLRPGTSEQPPASRQGIV
jgi:hypothetical protein